MLSKKQRRLNKTQLFTASTNGRRRTVAKTQRCYSHLSSCCLQAIRWTRELNLKTLAKPDGMLPQYTVYCNPLPPVILSIKSLSLKFEPFSNQCGKKKKKNLRFLHAWWAEWIWIRCHAFCDWSDSRRFSQKWEQPEKITLQNHCTSCKLLLWLNDTRIFISLVHSLWIFFPKPNKTELHEAFM